jgi:hypothetical protein
LQPVLPIYLMTQVHAPDSGGFAPADRARLAAWM